MAQLFPMFLKLEGVKCLVVGGGGIAEQKIEGLLVAGARVIVVAPEASNAVRTLSQQSKVEWIARPFQPGDLSDVSIVIAATGDPTVNQEIFRHADARRVLCNAVDEPERCHFYYPAVVRRGDLQIAVSTAGNSPALAQRIRTELEQQFGPEYDRWLQWLGAVRNRLFRSSIDPDKRRRMLHRIASERTYERFRRSRRAQGGSR